MKTMFTMIKNQLTAGKPLVLATVVGSTGSTPRGAGARMLVGETGRLWGTIGGGAIEYRCLELAHTVLQTGLSIEETFQLNPQDLHKLGMVCGGSARVLLQFLSPDSLAVADRAVRELEAGGELWLVSHCSGGLNLYRRNEVPRELHSYLTRRPLRVQEEGLDLFIEQIGILGSVYLFGAGHVGRELEPLLSRLGFRCIVVDDRPEFADKTLFPTAADVICADLENLPACVAVGPEDYVCIMTRGHAHDTAVLTQVLKKQPRYVGLMGSRRKIAAVHEVLRQSGFSQEQIDHVTAPIGLAIGAQNPAEIAVSVAAQLIAIRAEI